MGSRDDAFDALDKACVNGWIDYRALSLDPRFEFLHEDRRFTSLLKDLAEKVATLNKEQPPGTQLAQNRER